MMNGKFFTGLPANMVNRRSGPDRQKSNFFWPDEDDATDAKSPKSSSKQHLKQSDHDNIQPKKLFHDQLSSKIEFLDAVDAHGSPVNSFDRKNNSIVKGLDNANYLNNSKPNTITIKPKNSILLEDQYNQNKILEKPNLSSKNMIEKKKITFDNHDTEGAKKGILKNSETMLSKERNIAIDMPSANLTNFNNSIHKKSLSKSVENVAKFAIDADIARLELNKLNLTKEKPTKVHRSKFEETEEDYYIKNNVVNPIINHHKVTNDYIEHHNASSNNVISKKEVQNGWTDRKGHAEYQRVEKSNMNMEYRTNTINLNPEQQSKDGYIRSDKSHPKQLNDKISSTYNNSIKNNIIVRDENVDGCISSNKRPSITNTGYEYPNEARVRAHSHLKSSIFFNDNP